MPDTLTNQQIAEIELREYVVEGWGRFIKLRPDERDSLITTVKELREQLFEEQARNQTQADSIMDAESEITSLQSQLEDLRKDNEELSRVIFENQHAQHMRDKCVEKMESYRQRIQYEPDEGVREALFGDMVLALGSLTLNQEEPII